MDRADVDRWLADYVEAWKIYDRDRIGALFSADVACRYHPYDEPILGRDAVVESWLGEGDHPGAPDPDPEGTYEGEYEAVAVDGDVAVATGKTTYTDEPGGRVTDVYYNCFVIRFDGDGRCREFTEYFIKRPQRRDP